MVVESELFTGFDAPIAEQHDAATRDGGAQIGLTAMVNEFGSAAANRAVYSARFRKMKNIEQWPQGAAISLSGTNFLAGVFDHAASSGNRLCSENAPAVDCRCGCYQSETTMLVNQFRDRIGTAGKHHFTDKRGEPEASGAPIRGPQSGVGFFDAHRSYAVFLKLPVCA